MHMELRSSGRAKLKRVSFLSNSSRKIDVVWVVGASFTSSRDGVHGYTWPVHVLQGGARCAVLWNQELICIELGCLKFFVKKARLALLKDSLISRVF